MARKKKPDAPKPYRMSLKDIIGRHEEETAIVKVPEFGIDENGDAWEVIVRGLSVLDKNMLNQIIRKRGTEEEHSLSIIVAMGSIDANGDLLFGETRAEAIEQVYALPERFAAPLGRIAIEILRLTGQRVGDNGQSVSESVAIEDAEKN